MFITEVLGREELQANVEELVELFKDRPLLKRYLNGTAIYRKTSKFVIGILEACRKNHIQPDRDIITRGYLYCSPMVIEDVLGHPIDINYPSKAELKTYEEHKEYWKDSIEVLEEAVNKLPKKTLGYINYHLEMKLIELSYLIDSLLEEEPGLLDKLNI